ncbi:MAG: LLM class flavin-dependent oxidoreductase [Gammaproteobacteria bacterium]
MITWRMSIDFKCFEENAAETLYRVALEQAAWADARGVTQIWVDEHHGSQNLTSPLAMAAAVGAVTRRARIGVGCLLLPLLDPIRVAEDAITADLVSQGRLEIIAGLGYVPHEFEMYGVSLRDRARLMDEKLPVLLDCLAGRPFEYRGRRGRVLPLPFQKPRPPVLVGGAVEASARRAARLGDGFAPAADDPVLYDLYLAECERLGRAPGPIRKPGYPLYVFVSRDPERAWARLAPHLLHEVNQYAGWSAAGNRPRIGYVLDHGQQEELANLRRKPNFGVLTPEECVALARSKPDGAHLAFKPTRTGLDVDLGWESLELFVSDVLPHIEIAPPAPMAPVRDAG